MELLIRRPELKDLAARIFRGLATDEDFRSAKLEDVRAIKADTGERHYRTLAKPIERDAKSAPRSQRYVASDESVDRMGDIIRQNGWDHTTFKENPQALWAHMSREFPIGTVTDIHIGKRNGRKSLIEEITYLEEGLNPTADILWKLVDKGVIRAVSVGFLPTKIHWPESEKEREELGLGTWGCVYEKQEQLELSNCTVPANANALATKSVHDALRDMITAGEISERDAEAVVDLSEQRKTVVSVAAMPEAEKKTDEAPKWVFQVGEDGVLRQVRVSMNVDARTVPEEVHVDTKELEQDLAELKAESDLNERFAKLELAVAELTAEIRSLPEKVTEAVGRSLLDPKRLLKTTLEAALIRSAHRLSQESL